MSDFLNLIGAVVTWRRPVATTERKRFYQEIDRVRGKLHKCRHLSEELFHSVAVVSSLLNLYQSDLAVENDVKIRRHLHKNIELTEEWLSRMNKQRLINDDDIAMLVEEYTDLRLRRRDLLFPQLQSVRRKAVAANEG